MKTKPHLSAHSSRAWGVLGVLLILLCWQLSALFLGPLLMATPMETARAIPRLVMSGRFLNDAGASLLRVAIGVSVGCSIGFTLGILAAHSPRLRGLLEPLRWLLMAIRCVLLRMSV